jgi:hypothetical protein
MDHGDSGRAVAHDGRPFGRARKGEVDWVRPAGWWRRSSTLAGVRSIGNGIPQRRRRCRGVHFLPDRRQSQTNFAGLLTVRVNAIAKCDPFLAEWVPRCLALQPTREPMAQASARQLRWPVTTWRAPCAPFPWTVEPTRILTHRELGAALADLKRQGRRSANARQNRIVVRLVCSALDYARR